LDEEKEAEKEKPFNSSMEIIQDYTGHSTIQGIDAHTGLRGGGPDGWVRE
jgi:hypothetical protein